MFYLLIFNFGEINLKQNKYNVQDYIYIGTEK